MMELSKVITFSQGPNQMRLSKDMLHKLYVRDCYIRDLFVFTLPHSEIEADYVKDMPLKKGDIIISPVHKKAVVVGKENKGLYLDNNFIKVNFISKDIDKNYFLFLFNEGNQIKEQMGRELQGSIVFRLTINQLRSFRVRLPKIKKQKILGNIYMEIERLKNLKKQEINMYDKFMKRIIGD